MVAVRQSNDDDDENLIALLSTCDFRIFFPGWNDLKQTVDMRNGRGDKNDIYVFAKRHDFCNAMK